MVNEGVLLGSGISQMNNFYLPSLVQLIWGFNMGFLNFPFTLK